MTATAEAPVTEIVRVALDALKFHPLNPPRADADIQELAVNIQENGLLQLPAIDENSNVLAGERRIRALRMLAWTHVDCIVKRGLEAHKAVLALLSANREHRAPEPLAEAATINELRKQGCSIDLICEKLGVSRKWVAQRACFVKLSPQIQEAYRAKKPYLAHFTADMLAELSVLSTEDQEDLIPNFDGGWSDLSRMRDAADVEAYVAETTRLLGSAPWDLDDEALVPDMGSCLACPHQTLHAPDLFGDGAGGDIAKARCLLAECYGRKTAAMAMRVHAAKKDKNEDAVIVIAGAGFRKEQFPGQRVVFEFDAQEAKKSDKGAVPATILGTNGITQGWYVVAKDDVITQPESDEEEAAAAPAPEKKEDPQEKLARSMLQISRRRKAIVVDCVRKSIDMLEAAVVGKEVRSVDFVHDLIVTYGVMPTSLRKNPDGRKALVKETVTDATWLAEIWPRVRQIVVEDLRRTNPSEIDAEYETASWLSEGFLIAFERFVDDADATVPDPKWWAAYAPKPEVKPKKVKKAAKKAKRKKK